MSIGQCSSVRTLEEVSSTLACSEHWLSTCYGCRLDRLMMDERAGASGCATWLVTPESCRAVDVDLMSLAVPIPVHHPSHNTPLTYTRIHCTTLHRPCLDDSLRSTHRAPPDPRSRAYARTRRDLRRHLPFPLTRPPRAGIHHDVLQSASFTSSRSPGGIRPVWNWDGHAKLWRNR